MFSVETQVGDTKKALSHSGNHTLSTIIQNGFMSTNHFALRWFHKIYIIYIAIWGGAMTSQKTSGWFPLRSPFAHQMKIPRWGSAGAHVGCRPFPPLSRYASSRTDNAPPFRNPGTMNTWRTPFLKGHGDSRYQQTLL